MKWFLSISAVSIFIAMMALEAFGYPGSIWCGFFAMIALLAVANLEVIEWIKATGSGVEAKTRDIVKRAETALDELQVLATHVAQLTLSLVIRQGRLGGYSDKEQDAIRESVLDVLTKIGLDSKSKEIALKDWHIVTAFDYTYLVLGGHTTPSKVSSEAHQEWRSLREGGIESASTPSTLRTFLDKYHLRNDVVEGYLLDYEYYLANHAHRRPEIWAARQSVDRLMGNVEPT